MHEISKDHIENANFKEAKYAESLCFILVGNLFVHTECYNSMSMLPSAIRVAADGSLYIFVLLWFSAQYSSSFFFCLPLLLSRRVADPSRSVIALQVCE